MADEKKCQDCGKPTKDGITWDHKPICLTCCREWQAAWRRIQAAETYRYSMAQDDGGDGVYDE
jgi:hypothetical protein